MPPPPAPHPAWVFLRSQHEGTLSADGAIEKLRFVIDGATGRVVFPAHASVLEAEELVLFVPEEAPQMGPELQLLLSRNDLDADSEPADRWKAYHGDPRQPRWLACTIDGGKFAGEVVEPESLAIENPLRAAEPRLCKRLNADKPALARACERLAKVAVREPLAVGLDPTGIDVRARFGTVHLSFDPFAWTPDAASSAVETLLGSPA
jgi:hypothetical protein